MMKRFVERNAAGKIVGSFAAPQPGRAEEELPGNTAELAAFENPPPETDAEKATSETERSPAIRGIIRVLAKRFNVTPAAIAAEIRAELRK